MVHKPHPTLHATALKHALEEKGLDVESEVFDGHKHIDLTIKKARLNIEVDGEQHLTSSNQILSDISRSHFSAKKGYNTLHVSNSSLEKHFKKIVSAISTAAKTILKRKIK